MKRSDIPPAKDRLFAAAKLVGCFGIGGFVKIQPVARTPGRFTRLREVYVGPSAETTSRYRIESVEEQHKGTIVKFATVDDRTAAEKLIGLYIFVAEEDLATPDRGSYLVDDVIGCEVVSTEGKKLGLVKEVYRLPAQDLWEIETPAGPVMLPAVKEFVVGVDMERRRITVRIIEGLFETGRKNTTE